MKILFSNPPWWEFNESDIDSISRSHGMRQGIRAGSRWPFTRPAQYAPDFFRYGSYLPFPDFLIYAAGYTARELPEAQVTMRDSIGRGESYNKFFEHIADEHYDWIVLETSTPSWPHDARLLDRFAALSPNSKIIFTGPVMETLNTIFASGRYPNVVAWIDGEPDQQIARVIRDGLRGFIPFAPLTEEQMNAAPLPLWDKECFLHYWDACPQGQRAPHLQIWSSRGCYYKCIFCARPAMMFSQDPDGTKSRTVRYYTPETFERNVRDRLTAALDLGVEFKSVYIDDDMFNMSEAHVLGICDAMKRIGLPWTAMCRIDTSKPETWRAMKDSGCVGVKVGFESGSQHVNSKIVNKRLDLVKAEDYWLPLLREIGIAVHTTWTVGLPGETEAQQQETRLMIARLYEKRLHATHQLSGTAEIEGTPLHTLRTAGALPKYDGASLDPSIAPESDGQKKIETM